MAEQRQHERLAWEGPVRAKCATWGDFLNLYTSNISHGGLFIAHEDPPEEGLELTIEIEMPNHEVLKLDGRVAHVSPRESEAPTGFGVEFVNVADTQVRHIAELVRLAESHSAAPPPPLPK